MVRDVARETGAGEDPEPMKPSPLALAIHGGCGVPPEGTLTATRERRALEGMRAALEAGWRVLDGGGAALDAVEAAVVALEEDPSFNAGRGSVFNAAGEHEMDAAIMDGRDRSAGAVAGVQRIRNPVRAARAVMRLTGHVMLIGPHAERFAGASGLELVDPSWFSTEERREILREVQALAAAGRAAEADQRLKHGTVGAVALDATGHLAAATSTGGYTNKMPGRVGDTPIVGAGTFADDSTLAFSGTGKGEIFMRSVAGHSLHAHMALAGRSLPDAADLVIHDELRRMGGGAGLIAVDRTGTIAMPYNTVGMYRGIATPAGIRAAIYADPAMPQRGACAPD